MRNLPFRNIDEAKENASSLLKEFAFFSLLKTSSNDESSAPFSLQQLHSVIAHVLGCNGWKDLTSCLSLNERASYLDENGDVEKAHRALVDKFADFVHHPDKRDRIYRALHAISFGCSPRARRSAPIGIQRKMWRVTNDFDKCSEVFLLRQGRAAMARYDHLMSPYDAQILDWGVEREIALILGKKPPRRPSIPKDGHALNNRPIVKWKTGRPA